MHLRHVLRGHDRHVTRLGWAPDGIGFATAGQDGAIRLWDPLTGRLIRELAVPAEQLRPRWDDDDD
ncbi:hypothetical protein, partial [Klebsiella pneumoniae]|uniref:WD40 domain-containing protein n=1 Tax=Klebsiella pneumoniae TaxID=573 RepID=UPI003390188B